MTARPVIDRTAVAAALRREKAQAFYTGPLPAESRACAVEVVARLFRREVTDCAALAKALDAAKALAGTTPDAVRLFAAARDEARALVRLRAAALRLFGERIRVNMMARVADVTKLPEVSAALAGADAPGPTMNGTAESYADALAAGFDELIARSTS